MTATTALTAQNTQGVHDIHHIPPKFVCRQIDACIDDIGVDVIKIGTTEVITIYGTVHLFFRYAGFSRDRASRGRNTQAPGQGLSIDPRSCTQA